MIRLHLFRLVMEAGRALVQLAVRLDPGRCEERESGGVRCELVAGHKRGHFIHLQGDKPHPERYRR